MKKNYTIWGMHCVSCAQIITTKLTALSGVKWCEVHFATKEATLDYDSNTITESVIQEEVKKYWYTLIPDKKEEIKSNEEIIENPELEHAWNMVLVSIPIVALSIGIMTWMIWVWQWWWSGNDTIKEFFHHLLPILATVMLTVVGWKYVIAIGRYIRYGVANMDTLVGIGTVTAFIYSFALTAFEWQLGVYLDTDRTFYESVIVVIGFVELGKYLEAKIMAKTGKAIRALVWLQSKDALIKRWSTELRVTLDQVNIGDLMIVKPWEKIPLDGTIIEGQAHIDESMITGESLPVSKNIDDVVIGGTIVSDSTLIVRATALGSDGYLSKIISIVSAAQNSKPQIQKVVDKIMRYFVPGVLILALIAWGFWLFFGRVFFPDINHIEFAILSFVGVLVIACPCGLGLATPMAIITGVWHGAKNGILAKNAEWILSLRKSKIVVFDKTGTITEWRPELIDQKHIGEISNQLSILASLETLSSHPIASGIARYASEHDIQIESVSGFQNIAGAGVEWTIGNALYRIYKPSHLTDMGIDYDTSLIETWTHEGKTPLILLEDKTIIGYYSVADKIKSSSKEAIQALKDLWITPVMLTGDHTNTAHYIASQIGIDRVYAGVKPEQKAEIIKELQKEWIVTMVWDGINDAPALATADIGIAMSTGTDVAIEAADLTILHGDLSKIAKAYQISRLTHVAIYQNLAWAFGFNLVGIPLAMGVFYPVLGILLSPAFEWAAMAMSDLTVIGNSLRLQKKKI